jgi:hypothetical protein
MPNATFLVTLDLETIDPVSLQQETETLTETIEKDFEVVEVKPWAHPMSAPTATTTGPTPLSGL